MDSEPSELLDCFQFVQIDFPCAEWWPCLRFDNLEALDVIVNQWDILPCNHRRPSLPADKFGNQLGVESVAFLLGENPPFRYLFDCHDDRLNFQPFLRSIASVSLRVGPLNNALIEAIDTSTGLLDSKLRECLCEPRPLCVQSETSERTLSNQFAKLESSPVFKTSPKVMPRLTCWVRKAEEEATSAPRSASEPRAAPIESKQCTSEPLATTAPLVSTTNKLFSTRNVELPAGRLDERKPMADMEAEPITCDTGPQKRACVTPNESLTKKPRTSLDAYDAASTHSPKSIHANEPQQTEPLLTAVQTKSGLAMRVGGPDETSNSSGPPCREFDPDQKKSKVATVSPSARVPSLKSNQPTDRTNAINNSSHVSTQEAEAPHRHSSRQIESCNPHAFTNTVEAETDTSVKPSLEGKIMILDKRARRRKAKKNRVVVLASAEFSDVQKILEVGGYSFYSSNTSNLSCRRPCGMPFPTVEGLRTDLCAYGISCKCMNRDGASTVCPCWNTGQRCILRRWVRSSVIRGERKDGTTTKMDPDCDLLPRLGCVKFHSDLGECYKLPCVKNPTVDGILGSTTFPNIGGLLRFLVRFGLPDDCTFDQLSVEERFKVEAYLAARKREDFKPHSRETGKTCCVGFGGERGSSRDQGLVDGPGPPADDSISPDGTNNKPNKPERQISETTLDKKALDQDLQARQSQTNVSPSTADSLSSTKKEGSMIDVAESPLFSNVRYILERGGYRFYTGDDDTCYRPCGRKFDSIPALRRDLCAYGVNCQCGTTGTKACLCWDETTRDLIHRWVRYSVVRGPLQSGQVKKLTMTKLFEFGARLGFTFDASSGTFRFPNAVTIAKSREDLILRLARFGLPDDCTFSNLTKEERLCVENCLAMYCPLASTFTFQPCEE